MKGLVRLTLAVVTCMAAATAFAQAFPARPVRIIVPFPAGGTTDILARQISAELAARCEAFEVPLVVISPVVGMSGREMRTLGVESAHPVDPGTGSADGLTRTARRLAEGWTPRW